MSGLSRFRQFARVIAAMLLLTGPVVFQHEGRDDFACAPGGATDRDIAEIAAAPSGAAQHCLVCHWTRSLRTPSPSSAYATSLLITATTVDVAEGKSHRAPALDRLPARAPPRN